MATAEQEKDPGAEQFQAAKSAFEAALEKTKRDAGDTPAPAPKKAKAKKPEPKPEPVAEAPKEEPAAPAVDVSGLEKRLADLQSKLEALSTKPEEPEEEEEPEDPYAEVREDLKERFGEDEGEALLKALDKIAGPQAKRLKDLEKYIAEAANTGRKNISSTNKKRLRESYSNLTDDAWEMIHERVVAGFGKDPKKWASAEDAYDAVTRSIYGEPSKVEDEEVEADEEEQNHASRVAASSLTPPTRTKEKPKDKEAASRELFQFLFKHPDDKQGAAKLARDLGIN